MNFVPDALKDKDTARLFYSDLALGILFAVIGIIGYVIKRIKQIKMNNKASQTDSFEDYNFEEVKPEDE